MFEFIKYIKHKLNRPLLFWPVKFGMDWLVILTHRFYRNGLNISWKTYVLKPEGNFNKNGKEAEENNLIISILKYSKITTIEKILSKDDLEIKYIDTNLSPLHYAHINKNKEMIDILNKYGADKNIKTLKGYKPDDL